LRSSSSRGISTNPIREAQTSSPTTAPQEWYTPRRLANAHARELHHPRNRSSAGMTNGGPSRAQVVVACVAPEKCRGDGQRPKPFCRSCCSRAAASLVPSRDENERSAGSDLDNKVVVGGKNMPALTPDVVEREKA
jgi:hypothetical protein